MPNKSKPAPPVESIALAPPSETPLFGTLPDKTLVRLRLHPNLEVVRGWEDEPRFETLCASVAEIGVISPLLIHLSCEMDPETGAEWADVVDGKHRFKAADRALHESMTGFHPVPVEVTTQSADEVIIVTLTNRRHLRKGAMAYLLYPLIKPQIEASKARRAANLKAGSSRKTPAEFIGKPELEQDLEDTLITLAEKHGLGRESLSRARRLHQHLEEFPDDRAEWEAALLSGTVGLSGLMGGIGGSTTKDKARAATAEPSVLCSRFLKSFRHNFSPAKWASVSLPQKAKIQETLLASVLEEWPAEIVAGLRDALKQWKPAKKGGES